MKKLLTLLLIFSFPIVTFAQLNVINTANQEYLIMQRTIWPHSQTLCAKVYGTLNERMDHIVVRIARFKVPYKVEKKDSTVTIFFKVNDVSDKEDIIFISLTEEFYIQYLERFAYKAEEKIKENRISPFIY